LKDVEVFGNRTHNGTNPEKGRLIYSMRRMVFVLSFLLLLGGDPVASQRSDTERLEELRRAIEQEIGVPAANDASQCKLIPFGSKPCGGPWSYLVYSTLKTDEARLKQLVSDFNQLQRQINEESKTLSDCAITPEPKVEFTDRVCAAKR
jgi:hypothetical protein